MLRVFGNMGDLWGDEREKNQSFVRVFKKSGVKVGKNCKNLQKNAKKWVKIAKKCTFLSTFFIPPRAFD